MCFSLSRVSCVCQCQMSHEAMEDMMEFFFLLQHLWIYTHPPPHRSLWCDWTPLCPGLLYMMLVFVRDELLDNPPRPDLRAKRLNSKMSLESVPPSLSICIVPFPRHVHQRARYSNLTVSGSLPTFFFNMCPPKNKPATYRSGIQMVRQMCRRGPRDWNVSVARGSGGV